MEDFTLTQSSVLAPGFSVNRLRIGVDVADDAVTGPGDPLNVVQPMGPSRIAYVDTHYPADVHASRGDLVLLPPDGPSHIICEPLDALVVQLDRSAVARYAAAMTGLDADDLTFDRITPLSPALAQQWAGALTHVRDHVLDDPWAAEQPILVDQAFRTLAAAVLSTFPNTALARIADPGSTTGPR